MDNLKAYEFTLVLEGGDEETPELEDCLFEVGCDDALINFRNGTVYLDFYRSASSMEEAIIAAIQQVESTNKDIKVISILPEDLVGEAEIAKRLNKGRQTVSLWVKREHRQARQPFSHLVAKLADKSPMWRWHDIVSWLYQQRIIHDKELVNNAKFFESINAVLGERDPVERDYRHRLLIELQGRSPDRGDQVTRT